MKLLTLLALLIGCSQTEDLKQQVEYDWLCECRLVWVDDGTTATYWKNSEAPEEYRRSPWAIECASEEDVSATLEEDPDECSCVAVDPCTKQPWWT